MEKFKGVFFATDLDGTLVNNDKTIPGENLRAINYFMERGGLFTFVTGRSPIGAVDIYEQLKPNAPCGCLNGGSIYDFSKREILWCREISKDVLKLVKYIDEKIPAVGIEVHTHSNVYFCKPNCGTEEHKAHENLPDLYCHYNDISEPIAKILFSTEREDELPELIDALKQHPMSEKFDFIRSDKLFYEVLPKGASKGDLVIKIARMFDIKPERIITAGDNDNDISMLEVARFGFAVSNSTDNVKRVADFITVSNEECAIARIIEMIDKGILDI